MASLTRWRRRKRLRPKHSHHILDHIQSARGCWPLPSVLSEIGHPQHPPGRGPVRRIEPQAAPQEFHRLSPKPEDLKRLSCSHPQPLTIHYQTCSPTSLRQKTTARLYPARAYTSAKSVLRHFGKLSLKSRRADTPGHTWHVRPSGRCSDSMASS